MQEERYELIMKRIEELAEMNPEDEKEAFFSFCAGALQNAAVQKEEKIPQKYLEHPYGSRMFIKEWEPEMAEWYSVLYVTILYAFTERENQELFCIFAELLVEMNYTLREETENAAADTFYWFFSDYCELYLPALLRKEGALQFGGPFLVHKSPELAQAFWWKEHLFDCSIYVGKRYRERFLQSVEKETLVQKNGFENQRPKETEKAASVWETFISALKTASTEAISKRQLEILSELLKALG